MKTILYSWCAAIVATGCVAEAPVVEDGIFDDGKGDGIGWLPWDWVFTDLPADENVLHGFYELDIDRRTIPGLSLSGLVIQGNNHSRDLGMYMVKRMKVPTGYDYRVTVQVELATNGCAGRDAPIMLGATNMEPANEIDEGGMLRLSGRDPIAFAAGRTGDGAECPADGSEAPYRILTRSHSVVTRPDARGHLWILAGIEAELEGVTAIYVRGLWNTAVVPSEM